ATRRRRAAPGRAGRSPARADGGGGRRDAVVGSHDPPARTSLRRFARDDHRSVEARETGLIRGLGGTAPQLALDFRRFVSVITIPMNDLVNTLAREQLKADLPEVRPGDTVRVSVRVVEGNRDRLRNFAGVVLRVRNG